MTFYQITEILKTKRVGIAGCGGLGSNCAVALARVGVGRLVIADFDLIEEGNLNRQYFFYHQIGRPKVLALKENIGLVNPKVVVESHEKKIVTEDIPALFGSCDVVVEAFDLADQKEMLIEAMAGMLPGKPLVVGVGMAGWGKSELIHFRRMDNIYICGDEVSEAGPELPPLAPRVGMVANMQANVVLEILLGARS